MNPKSLNAAKQRAVKNKWWILAILLVIGAIGYGVYRDYSIKADKEKFEQAKASIDALYADIVATTGEPAKVEGGQTCGYAEFKNSKGPLSCMVRIAFVYPAGNNSEATTTFRSMSQALNINSNFKVTFTNESEVIPFAELESKTEQKEIGMSILEGNSDIVCSFRLIYADKERDSHYLMTDTGSENISGLIACKDDAKAEHYPSIN